jgi:peptide/nickel transport system permease protein
MREARGLVWRRFRRNSLAVAGLGTILALVLLAVLAPVLPLADPIRMDTAQRLKPLLSPGHALGTDEFGRDLLSRLVWGARTSLLVGLAAAGLSLLAGGLLGLVAGYFGAWLDDLIMRTLDVLLAFPFLLLAIAIVAALGPGLFNAMLAIAVLGLPAYGRVVRGIVLSLKEREFISSARALGARDARILARHLCPNLLAPILVLFTLDIGSKVIITASLSFLGLGAQPPTADWGYMLATGKDYIYAAPHVATLPGLAVFVSVLGFNLFGDGLRDALDPWLQGVHPPR